jgi:flagellar hook-associated protein 1 FlgK
MSLNSIMSSAANALSVNQTALKTVSGNISNINTEGYNRRVVHQSPAVTGSAVSGVSIAEIRRIADSYLARESFVSAGAAADAEVTSSFRDRANAIFGKLDGGASLVNRLSDVASAFGQLAVEPASTARRITAVGEVQAALSAIGGMAQQVQALRQDASVQLKNELDRANALIVQIADLNSGIKLAFAQGDTATGLLDLRDKALSDLSQIMDIQTYDQQDGRLFVSLTDGTQIVGDLRAQFSYSTAGAVTTSTSFPPIALTRVNGNTGDTVGPGTTLEGRVQGGSVRGLLDLRDDVLPDLAEELGAVAGGLADGLNAIHNSATAAPAAPSLSGVATGLLASDTSRFTGKTSLAVTDPTGAVLRRVDVDFDAGSLSINQGTSIGFGPTIGDFINALDTALAGDGSATIDASGVITISAQQPGAGVAFLQDAANPSSLGGRGFAQVFGLNDLVRSTVPFSGATGLALTDPHGFGAGDTMAFRLRAPSGEVLTQATFTVSGTTMSDLIAGLNTAAQGNATFSLDPATGGIVMTSAQGARMEVQNDSTSRGASGVSMSRMFALGTAAMADRAVGMTIRSDIRNDPSKLAAAKLDLTPATASGDIILGRSDNRAAQDMAALLDKKQLWPAAGGMAGGTMSIMEYTSQLVAAQSQAAQSAAGDKTFRDGVAAEVKTRRADVESVNLDEELTQMIMYQQAYNAAARIMTTVQDMYDTLISMKR